MAKGHMKRCSTWLIIREMQIETTIRYPIIPVRIGYHKKKTTYNKWLWASLVKNLPTMAGDMSQVPGSGRSPGEGNGNPLQYSCLGDPMDRGTGWGQSPWGHKRVRHNLETKQQQMTARMLSKGKPYTLLVEMQTGTILWKTVCKFLQKLKIELPYYPAVPFLGTYS